MNNRSILRALVVAALLAGSGTASADPTSINVCDENLHICASLLASTGTFNAIVETPVDPCVPDYCGGIQYGTGGDVAVPVLRGDLGVSWATHPWTATCYWEGSPGSRINIRAQLVPGPGNPVASTRIWCGLYANDVPTGTAAAGENTSAEVYAIDTETKPGDRVCVAMVARITWTDGTGDQVHTADCPQHL